MLKNELYQQLLFVSVFFAKSLQLCDRVLNSKWATYGVLRSVTADANAPPASRRDVASGRGWRQPRQSLHNRGTSSVEPLRCERINFYSVYNDSFCCVCKIVSFTFCSERFINCFIPDCWFTSSGYL
jgi:hypothetical protein